MILFVLNEFLFAIERHQITILCGTWFINVGYKRSFSFKIQKIHEKNYIHTKWSRMSVAKSNFNWNQLIHLLSWTQHVDRKADERGIIKLYKYFEFLSKNCTRKTSRVSPKNPLNIPNTLITESNCSNEKINFYLLFFRWIEIST